MPDENFFRGQLLDDRDFTDQRFIVGANIDNFPSKQQNGPGRFFCAQRVKSFPCEKWEGCIKNVPFPILERDIVARGAPVTITGLSVVAPGAFIFGDVPPSHK